MSTRIHPLFVGFIVLAGLLAVAIAASAPRNAQKPVPQIVATSSRPILSIDGKENFDAYCVVCHGKDAKGNGPAAPAMKAPVPDLTTMARRNGGKFDGTAVLYVVRGTGKTGTPAHGVEDMPIWGQAFRSGDEAKATLRIQNLVAFIESIQQR
jgi:mono/diheme cytochrome c family protein